LLVDALFTLPLAQQMLDTMAPVHEHSPIRHLVVTHAHGDHVFGAQLIAGPGVDVITTTAAAVELQHENPTTMSGIENHGLPPTLEAFLLRSFGDFDFSDIDVVTPTTTFDGRLSVSVGGREVRLYDAGPAHTAGDLIVHVPDADVVFAGDLLFIGSTPIMWAGPLQTWIDACDTILALAPSVVVPGHGPVTDADGVLAVRSYLAFVQTGVRDCFAAGLGPDAAVSELDARTATLEFGKWLDRERIAVTVHQAWREMEPGYAPDSMTLFQDMAALSAAHRRAERQESVR
jgi:glyoxylase-like metal-dependent hydrolase (beta-lactamase superfamily II)